MVNFVKRPGFPREKEATTTVAFDPVGLDAFGRLRVSEPFTLFSSKQISDNRPTQYDDAEVSGSGTNSSHSVDRASSTISVSGSTAGKRVRQTFSRFNYQAGKSHLIFCTGVMIKSGGGEGIVGEIGYFDDENGIFWKYDEGTNKLVIRSSVTGTAVDNEVNQDDWNNDTLDGNGPSGITLDETKAQILFFDFEWLGVGVVRCGFIIDGQYIIAHQFNHANNISSVYMSTPNLPIRYSIENTGNGQASELEHICSTVISEGGYDSFGSEFYVSNGNTPVAASTAGTVYALIGIKLKSSYPDVRLEISKISALNENTQDFEWRLVFNPTVAGTFTYTGLTNSAVDYALGSTSNTVTGGRTLTGGYVKSGGATGSITIPVDSSLFLGQDLSGNRDSIVLCASPLANNADIAAGITWREFD